MARKILSVIAGLLAAFLLIYGAQALGHAVYPPPAGLDFKDPEALRAYVATLPLGAFAFVLLGYALGSLAGGLVAALVSDRATARSGLIVGGLLLLAGLVNLMMVPHPLWFAITSTVLYLPLAWLGSRVLLRGVAGA